MENHLPGAIDLAAAQAERCVQKAEFYKTKSTASYRNQAADNNQAWADEWVKIEELLRELARLRNACRRSGINTDW